MATLSKQFPKLPLRVSDPNFGEVLVALLAISLETSLKLKNFTLEEDSLAVIMALQHPSIVLDWQIEKVIVNDRCQILHIGPPLAYVC